jgi:hypothetical protein
MKGFPIDERVTAENLAIILKCHGGSPINQLRRLRLWAMFQNEEIRRPEHSGRQDPPRDLEQLYRALDGHGIENPPTPLDDAITRIAEPVSEPVSENTAPEGETTEAATSVAPAPEAFAESEELGDGSS